MPELRINGFQNDSIVDGHGFRYVIFTQGCPHRCKGCHNPTTHDFSCGKLVDTDSLLIEIKANLLLSGVTFSGGEPIMQAKSLSNLAEKIREETQLDIIIYSGYTVEELMSMRNAEVDKLLSCTFMLIDGRYIEEERDLEIGFKGSRNQREVVFYSQGEGVQNFDLKLRKWLD